MPVGNVGTFVFNSYRTSYSQAIMAYEGITVSYSLANTWVFIYSQALVLYDLLINNRMYYYEYVSAEQTECFCSRVLFYFVYFVGVPK